MGAVLPTRRLDVRIDGTGDEERTIELSTADPALVRLVEVAR
jgi:hypothetical protein